MWLTTCCIDYPKNEIEERPRQGKWATCPECGKESRLFNDEYD